MRLSAEKIKAAILDSDSDLRTAAVYYFAHTQPSDPSLMSLVIQAVERFGPDAFPYYSFLSGLVQTDESIPWICRQLDQIDPAADETASDFFIDLLEALREADSALLERHAATIRDMRQLDEDSQALISNRIQLASLAPQALWQRLLEFCQEQDQNAESAADNHEFGCSIVDALAQYPDQFAGEVLKILEREKADDWLQVMAVRLAGATRLEAAIAALVGLLVDVDSWAGDGARWSLRQIGTDSVVREMAARYTVDEDLRGEIACLLKDFHSDLSVQTCLELLDHEQEDEFREYLILSLLANFASEGIEPARQLVLTREKTPDVLEVRAELLLACKMLEARFPEFDAWLEDSADDAEFRRAWYEEHGEMEFPEFDDEDALEADELDDDIGGDFDDHPAETIVRHDEKVGRNEPCPCGSGKKYKKCCLHKPMLG